MLASDDDIHYRLKLAEGFLEESRQDFGLQRWRSCVDNSQMATENAGKAVLAMLGPVGRTHNPAALLQARLAEGRFPRTVRSQVQRLIECAKQLGPSVHIETDYGDETSRRTPWELFDEKRTRQTLELAEEAVALSRQITQNRPK